MRFQSAADMSYIAPEGRPAVEETEQRMPITYRRISGRDLAEGIAAAGISPEQFAALYGVPHRRLEKWLTDKVEVPHGVALFVGLIADPLVLEKALILTKYMVEKTEEPAAGKAAAEQEPDAPAA
ncbi:MAG: hypothetical protein DI565_08565 [Ancylobacter novellus]|uniref:Uncharacterized protein n=1 Tax=Ancylobacter novellus TaxID=921 RepID=A0A2W5MQH5_ANCNO|nr:MAG: hypothetical protein DI565_08565 [Ancylobacter novellus]